MLFPAPYDVLEKKAKKTAKGTRSGLRQKGASDMSSEDETHSSVAEDEARRKKKAASPRMGKEEKRGFHESGGEGAQEGEGLPCG